MKLEKLPYFFNVKKYKELNPDLQYLSDEDAIKHYKNYGFDEKRKYCIIKTALLFHVGNINVFLKIYNNHSFFFKRNILIFITLHNKDFISIISQYIPNAFFTIIENKGADIGGFLKNMKLLINHPNYIDIEYIYFMHTKTNDDWRRDMLLPITYNYKKIESMLKYKSDTSIIVGCEKYCYRNKGTNRNYIKDIFDRNKYHFDKFVDNDWREYFDDYIFENTNIEVSKNIYTDLNINPEFYKNYENDLKLLSNNEAIKQFKHHGINEYYRINNPCYIKNFGKESYFIAGTIFMCNKQYFKIFEGINFDYEYDILETGYVLNTIPRKIHAWEYLFGLLVYCMNGCIVSIDKNGNMNDMKNKYNVFNIDIYRNCNMDLKYYNDIDLLNRFNSRDKNENRIFSISQLYKTQAIINIGLLKANIAICLKIPSENYSDEYKNILVKIFELSSNGEFIDIYFGVEDNNMNYSSYHGLSVINKNIYYIVDQIKHYEVIVVDKYNFYLGFNLQRKYEHVMVM
jgi:hypothetical protein